MAQTTLELVPNVYQEMIDDVALNVTKQWKIAGMWTTTILNWFLQTRTGIQRRRRQGAVHARNARCGLYHNKRHVRLRPAMWPR